MLSVQNIIDILEPNQKEYFLKDDQNSLSKNYEDIEDIFDNKFFINKYNINLENDFSNFFGTILLLLDESFSLTEKKFKLQKIDTFIKRMIVDYDNENLYYKYYYNKNKKIKKTLIQTYLYEILNKNNIENIYVLQQFICDYLSVNIFIISKDKDENKFIYSKAYENKINKYLPILVLYHDIDNYYSIMNDTTKILLYSKHKEIIHTLFKKFKVFINKSDFDKKTLTELREIVKSKGLDIKKKSELSGKQIYLKKDELLDKIRDSYEF